MILNKQQKIKKKQNKLNFIPKRTMLSSLRNSTTIMLGVGANYRCYSSWGAWKFHKSHSNYDAKGHYTAIKDDDIKNNAKIPNYRFTHASPGKGHPSDAEVLGVTKISETDLNGSKKPQSVARRKGFLSKEDLAHATRESQYDNKLANGQPMSDALDEVVKKHNDN